MPTLGDQVRAGDAQSESRLEGGREKPPVSEDFLKEVFEGRARLEGQREREEESPWSGKLHR